MSEPKPRIVIVGGPTASGKTVIGIRLAERFHGEIVSADSMQIYRYMDVGTAKPTLDERSRVPHHMMDIRDPDEDFSAGDYVREARTEIAEILGRQRLPLVVGGTGLYIRLLLGGVVELPPSNPELRRRLLEHEQSRGSGTLFAKLREVDPDAAEHLGPHNLVRICRALEVFETTGRKMSELHVDHGFRDRPYRSLFLCCSPGRDLVYQWIDTRVDCMIKEGLWDEVRKLHGRGYSRGLKSMQSLGYRHVGMALAGEISPQEAVRLIKRDTRRYAKRQFTWFRSEPEALWIAPGRIADIELAVANFLEP